MISPGRCAEGRMTNASILIVEDEAEIADLIVLDLMLPDLDGQDLLVPTRPSTDTSENGIPPVSGGI